MKRITQTVVALLALVACFVTPVLAMGMENPIEAGVSLLIATGVAATTRDLKTILAEAKAIQDKYTGQSMPAEEAKRFEDLCVEGEAIQKDQERKSRFGRLEIFGREVADPVLPDTKGRDGNGEEVVAYVSLGDAFVNSPEFKQYQDLRYPQAPSTPVRVPGLKTGLVPVTRKQMEAKAITFTGAVIQADRVAEFVRRPENDRLTLRDVLRTGNTDSNSIEFMVRSAFTNAAAPVAENALKPESAFTYEPATAPVRTVAHWTAVTEQQLADAPQLMGMVDDDLLYGLRRVEETQALWGAGTGENLLGIFNVPGVNAGRTETGDTIIDLIRRMITDVAMAGGEANAAVIHPLDWEDVQLAKASDNSYIWTVVTDPVTGESRIWGLRVVESVAAAEPGTYTTNERRVLVGDFRRGAALLDRQDASVQVGWINDQFIRNQRTLRAEERVALPVFMPAAFRYRITQARVL